MTTFAETPAETSDAPHTNPFPGPKAYSGDDQPYFFGRTEEIAELTSLVLSSSATLLYAPSGTGKSSLLQAGLAPHLEQRFGFVILPTVHLGTGARESTGDGEINQFVGAVCDTIRADDAEDSTSDIAAAAASRRTNSQRVLLILDQFEEVFNDPTLWAERDEFFVRLTAALDQNPWLRAVIALRSDYLAELVPHEPKLPGNLMVRYQLEHLTAEKAETAIRDAFEATGVGLADEDLTTLLDLLLEDDQRRRLGQRVRARHVNTIQLQIVCQPLWEELSHRDGPVVPVLARDSTPGMRRSMSRFVDEAITSAVSRSRANEAAIRSWLAQRLISPNGLRAFVQVGEPQTSELPIDAVEALANVKLIQLEQRHGSRLAELTHDSMVEGVRASNDIWLRKRYRRQRRWISLLLLVVLLGLITVFPLLRASDEDRDSYVPVLGNLADSEWRYTFTSTGRTAAITVTNTNQEEAIRAITVKILKDGGSGDVLGEGTLSTTERSVTVTVPTVRNQRYLVVLTPRGPGATIPFQLTVRGLAHALIDEDITPGINTPRVAVLVDADRFTQLTVSDRTYIDSVSGVSVVARGPRGSSVVADPYYPEQVRDPTGRLATIPPEAPLDSWVIVRGTSARRKAVLALVNPRTGDPPASVTLRRAVLPPPMRLELGRAEQVSITRAAVTTFSIAPDTPRVWADVACDHPAEITLLGTGDRPPSALPGTWRAREPNSRPVVIPLDLGPGDNQLVIASLTNAERIGCTVTIQPISGPKLDTFGQHTIVLPANRDFVAYTLALPVDAVLTSPKPAGIYVSLLCKQVTDALVNNSKRFLTLVPKDAHCDLFVSRREDPVDPGLELTLPLWVAPGGNR